MRAGSVSLLSRELAPSPRAVPRLFVGLLNQGVFEALRTWGPEGSELVQSQCWGQEKQVRSEGERPTWDLTWNVWEVGS